MMASNRKGDSEKSWQIVSKIILLAMACYKGDQGIPHFKCQGKRCQHSEGVKLTKSCELRYGITPKD